MNAKVTSSGRKTNHRNAVTNDNSSLDLMTQLFSRLPYLEIAKTNRNASTAEGAARDTHFEFTNHAKLTPFVPELIPSANGNFSLFIVVPCSVEMILDCFRNLLTSRFGEINL